MNYPLISDYIEAIKSADDNFATLTDLCPVLDERGNPVMTSGNFAVVFKMEDQQSEKFYAVKCFLKEQPNRAESYKMIADELEYVSSTYLVQFKYLEREIFVDTNNSNEEEFPVLVMDWVEGVTLDKYIRQNIDDQYALQMLAYQFSKLAMWIIPQPFAHGDIKPDNIMVRDDGSLVLIDYDGMYVPAMKGQKARELGSPDFRHPSRTEDDFDEHIDDFSLISILLSLRAIANDSSLLEKYGTPERLLFSEKDYCDISSCQLLRDLYPSNDNEVNTLVSIFSITLLNRNIDYGNIKYLCLARPLTSRCNKQETIQIITKEIESLTARQREAILYFTIIFGCDEYTRYHMDKTPVFFKMLSRLLGIGRNQMNALATNSYSYSYKIDAIKSINNEYIRLFFIHCIEELSDYNVKSDICDDLTQVFVDWGYNEKIEERKFSDILAVGDIFYKVRATVDKWDYDNEWMDEYGVTYSSDCKRLIKGNKHLSWYRVREGTITICDGAFNGCSDLASIYIPNSVKNIGIGAFESCSSLFRFTFPETITRIKSNIFKGCSSLTMISIPSSVTVIEENAFCNCLSIKDIIIPKSIIKIGNEAFLNCISLENVTFLGYTSLSYKVFKNCVKLRLIYIPSWTVRDTKGMLREYSHLIDRSKDYDFLRIWSLTDFIKLHGKMFVENKIDEYSGEVYKSCVFVNDDSNTICARCFENLSVDEAYILNNLLDFNIGQDPYGDYYLYDKTIDYWREGMSMDWK